MEIVAFIIIFIIIGLILGVIIEDANKAIVAIIIISILWAFVFGPWAIATFIELLIGYNLMKKIK